MTKGRHKKKVTQQGKSGSPKNDISTASRPMEKSSPANDVVSSAGLLSVTGSGMSMLANPIQNQPKYPQQQSQSFCHSEVLIKNINMTKGTPPTNQAQASSIMGPEPTSSPHKQTASISTTPMNNASDNDVTITDKTNQPFMRTPNRQLPNIANSTPGSARRLSGSARRNRKKLNKSTSSVGDSILDTSQESIMDTDSPSHTQGQVSSTPKRSLTTDLETPMSLSKKTKPDQQIIGTETGTIPKPNYLEHLRAGLLANAPPTSTGGTSASSQIRPPAFVAYIDTINGSNMTQQMANHIRDSLIHKLYDPPGFSNAPARFLQYGLVVNHLTSNNIFKIACADSKSVDWVLSAGNSLARFGLTLFKALRWNQLPKPISLFSFFVRKTEGDAETIKHNLARSNPEINIRKWTVHKSWAKEKGLLVCFGVDPVSYRFIQSRDMRLFFELSTVEFRHSHKDKPQTGSNTDTRTAASGTANADTRVSGTAVADTRAAGHGTGFQQPNQTQTHYNHHSPQYHQVSGAAGYADTRPGTVTTTDTRSGTASGAGTADALVRPNDHTGGAAGHTDTSSGTAMNADTRAGTEGPAGTASLSDHNETHQTCKSS